jgi:hypothetical protein
LTASSPIHGNAVSRLTWCGFENKGLIFRDLRRRYVNFSPSSVRSNSCSSCGLKSRPRSCPCALVVQGSGVLATGGREFPIGKAAGRNGSEPRCSLVSCLEMPTQWTYGEGQCSAVWRTEAAAGIFRGSRDGMLRKMSSAVLETRPDDAGGASTAAYKVNRSRVGSGWESEGFIVPFEGLGQHNPARGKGPCFVRATDGWRMRGLQQC